MMTTMVDHGHNAQPFLDGPQVRACNIELVRAEFYRQCVAEGDAQQKQNTRQRAFKRAIKDATARGVIATREMDDGVHLVWLVKPETNP